MPETKNATEKKLEAPSEAKIFVAKLPVVKSTLKQKPMNVLKDFA